MLKKIKTLNFPLYWFFLSIILCLMTHSSAYAQESAPLPQASKKELSFPDAKVKAYYDSINLKIAKLEREEKIKIERIKAKKYPPETEKNEIIKLKAKIKYAIGRYRDRGNLYFRQLNLPEPWLDRPPAEVSGTTVSKKSKVAEKTVSQKEILSVKIKEDSKENAQAVPKKNEVKPADKTTGKSEKDVAVAVANPPMPTSSTPSNHTVAVKSSMGSKSKEISSKAAWNWSAIITVICAIFCIFISCILVIISFLRWNKSGQVAKFALGCFAVFSIFLSIVFSISFVVILFANSKPGVEKKQDLTTSKFRQQNTETWHNLGANLFAEAVVENNQEKLFDAIGYLEKACAADPENKAITVDLADAYMEVNSPSLTAIAIEFYESVFESFADDPLLARIIAAYQQLGNYEAAFALSQKRMGNCPEAMRRATAIQMSFIAMSARKLDQAESAILADIQKRGEDALLRLIISTLKQAKGDQVGALAAVDGVLADKGVDPPTKEYALKLKESIAHE